MNNKKIVGFLDNLLEKGWLLLILFSPLFFAVFLNGVWQLGEALFFQIAVEILVCICIIKYIISKNYTFKISLKALLPLVFFFLAIFISTLLSNRPFFSFWGDYLRQMGFLLWLHVFLFFIFLFFNLKNIKQVERIAYTITFSSIVVAFYGLLQFLDLDPLTWSEAPTVIDKGRTFSTLGQPNFLASWLLLAIPIIVWLIIKKGYFHNFKLSLKTIFLRPALLSLFLISVLILVLTQSRGGWIGFIVSFFFFSIMVSFVIGEKRLGILLIILSLVSIIFVVYINMNPFYLDKANENTIPYRLKSFSHLLEKGQLRFMWWKDSIGLIQEKPIFGYGLETQRFNFMQFYRPKSATLEAINSYPDRIHNDILDTTYSTGLFGLFSYLLLILFSFYRGFKFVININDKKTKILALSFMTGILGYLVSIQFSFHVIPTLTYLFLYLVILIALPELNREKINKAQ